MSLIRSVFVCADLAVAFAVVLLVAFAVVFEVCTVLIVVDLVVVAAALVTAAAVLSDVPVVDPDVTFDVVVSVSFSFADVTVICVVVVVVCSLSSVVVTVVVVVSLTASVSAWLSDVLAFEHAVSIKASSRIAIFLLILSPPFVYSLLPPVYHTFRRISILFSINLPFHQFTQHRFLHFT